MRAGTKQKLSAIVAAATMLALWWVGGGEFERGIGMAWWLMMTAITAAWFLAFPFKDGDDD